MTHSLWSKIKKAFTIRQLVLIIFCAALLVWQLWPGSLEDSVFFLAITAIIWFPILLAVGVYTVFKIFRRYRTNREDVILLCCRLALNITIIFFTLGLLRFHVPLRISFCSFKSSFDSFIEEQQLDNTDTFAGEKAVLNKRFGIWTVDEYAKDSRGGTYFRIDTGSDMIDQLSYGFVFRPNREGTPFGNAGYKYSWIIGNWYYFRVSDDW